MHRSLIRAYLEGRSVLNSLRYGRRPPPRMPDELAARFTMNSTIPTLRWYVNDSIARPLTWTKRQAEANFRKVAARKQRYYGMTDTFLYAALDEYRIDGLDVVIIGSESPWYECICAYHGANVTTIEYRKIQNQISGITVMTPGEFAQAPRTFDVVISISSIEHDGLGRYGDPINPAGDLEAMRKFADLLKPDGLLLLAVPIGADAVVWNAHRIYGRIRFPLLLEGWHVVDSFGFDEQLFNSPLGRWDLQPVLVLKPTVPFTANERVDGASSQGTHSDLFESAASDGCSKG